MSDTDFCHNQEPLIGLFDKNSDELHVGLNKKNKKNPRSNFEKYVNTLVKYICNGEIINREKKKKKVFAAITMNLDKLISHIERKIQLIKDVHKQGDPPEEVVIDEFIMESFIEIPREIFVNVEDFDQSLENRPIQLESNQTISQPSLVVYMIKLLKLDKLKCTGKNIEILEIGTASGYSAVLLADCLADKACNYTVYTVEYRSKLVKKAIQNISNFLEMRGKEKVRGKYQAKKNGTKTPIKMAEFTFTSKGKQGQGQVVLYEGKGQETLGESVKYDRIIVTAGSRDGVHPNFINELKIGGILVIPILLGTKIPPITYIVIFEKKSKLDSEVDINKLNSYLNDMVDNGVKTKDINWENYEINIKIDIPVRFVPLEPLHQT